MLSNIIEKVKQVFAQTNQQNQLDAFIARQHPTSIGDVEYWITVYDRQQYNQRSANIGHYCR